MPVPQQLHQLIRIEQGSRLRGYRIQQIRPSEEVVSLHLRGQLEHA